MARLRVIYNVREAIVAHQAATGEDHYTYIYYYAFSSALEEVIEELELLAILIKPLVGVTAVTTSAGFNYQLSSDQLGLGPTMAATNLQLPATDHSSIAAVLGSEVSPLDEYGHHGPALSSAPMRHNAMPPSAVRDQLLTSSNFMNISGDESAPRPVNARLRKESSRNLHGAAATGPVPPSQSGTRSKPELKVTTTLASLKMDDPEYPSATFAQSPAVLEERMLGGMRQRQRLKEAIKTAQEASEHHVVELPSPTVAATSGASISVPVKNLPPSAMTPLTTVVVHESKTPMSPITPHGQTSYTALAAPPSPSFASASPSATKPMKSEDPSFMPLFSKSARHSPALSRTPGAVTHAGPSAIPFGSGLVPEAIPPLHMIPLRETIVAQTLVEGETATVHSTSASSNNGTKSHHSLGHTHDHHLHDSQSHHHHLQRRSSTSKKAPQVDEQQ
ncbi:hypothetical protein DFQ27_003460 [Actinomortierella ambigua]|uniref:Uncharacterized protein n=1 Tax=Actinomortierella ambigua TaxID=1343610 RepID=A0A9P6Q816_9FUNG|nr:hypothetical protein DFQ27_003460 [Actinomortierella ambigua]